MLWNYAKGKPVCVNIEINQRCAGGCKYCYASSCDNDELSSSNISLEKFKKILEISKLGAKVVYLYGGDQLLHPEFKEMVLYAIKKRFHVVIPLAGFISVSYAKWFVETYKIAQKSRVEIFIGLHIDTLDQNIYDTINNSPKTLLMKVNGYENLLNQGFPPDHIYGCPTLTKQTAEYMIELMNFFYNKGAKHVAPIIFRPLGLSAEKGKYFEPNLQQIEEVFYHRAKVEGKHMLAVGSSDGRYACQCHIAIAANGDVLPCLLLRDFSEGNIFQEDFLEIVKRAQNNLLLKIDIIGPCSRCEFTKYCCGCRANAYLYNGDIHASDPKCFFNKDAPNLIFK